MIKNDVRKHIILLIVINLCSFIPLSAQQVAAQTTAQAESAKPIIEKTLNTEELLSKTGAENLQWDPFFQSGVLVSGNHRIVFQAGNPGENSFAIVDNSDLLKIPSPYTEDGTLLFPEPFAEQISLSLSNFRALDLNRLRIAAIIIDPGHGGKDSGAVGNHTIDGKATKVVEKDIVLGVAKDLNNLLKSAYPDKQIIMTREGDTFPSLEDRVVNAHSVPLKDNEAIVFVSVHANASFNKDARGYEVWYLSPDYRRTVIDKDDYDGNSEVLDILNSMMEEEFTTESIMIAQSIMNRFDQNIGAYGPSRGIKAEEWFVVRNARMPSVLAELGFVSNLEDAKLLTNSDYLQKLSDAMYKGIVDFVSKFEQSGGFTQVP